MKAWRGPLAWLFLLAVMPLTARGGPSPEGPAPVHPADDVAALQQTVEELVAENERLTAEFEKALARSDAEIARLRAVLDGTRADYDRCRAEVRDLSDRSHELYGIYKSERVARWLDRLGCTIGYGATVDDEAARGPGVTCGLSFPLFPSP